MKMTPDERYSTRKQFFNDHAEQWLDMWYRDGKTGRYERHAKEFERLFSLLPLKEGDHVLDVGCGTGVLVPFILERITLSGSLCELDFAEQMIEVNRRLHQARNLKFLVDDAETAELSDDYFDSVICFSCFPHLHDKEKALKNLVRSLKPLGLLVMAHFDSSEGINKHHGSCHAVMHDHLPGETGMRRLLEEARLSVDTFIDEPGFYCVIARKSGER
jgi:ubiquinone/menaquinone biosynthesis C-methylase UbiE